MEHFTNYCQAVIQESYEFLNLLINIIRYYMNQITALFSWSKPTEIEIVLVVQSTSAHGNTQARRKSSKKGHRGSNSICLSSDIDLNIHEHIEDVKPPNEIRQNELKDDTTVLEKAASITEANRNTIQKETEKELLTANDELGAKVLTTKPEVLNTLPDKMLHEELPIPDIKQGANPLEAKPLVLPEKSKKPLPGPTKKRTLQPCKISKKQNVANNQHAVITKPRWR